MEMERLLAGSQCVFGLTYWTFVYLIPDMSKNRSFGESEVWKVLILDAFIVFPLCLWLWLRVSFKRLQGFVIGNVLAGVGLVFVSFGLYEENRSPLLYFFVYRIATGCSWVFVTYFGLTLVDVKGIKKLTRICGLFGAGFMAGAGFAPFFGYLVYDTSLLVVFTGMGVIFWVVAGMAYWRFDETEEELINEPLSKVLIEKRIFWEFGMLSVPFVLIFFMFNISVGFMNRTLDLPDMQSQCVFLAYKSTFVAGCLILPLFPVFYLNPVQFLRAGYLLAGLSFAILLLEVLQRSVFAVFIGMLCLGLASAIILLSTPCGLFEYIQSYFSEDCRRRVFSQIIFLSILLAYIGKFLGSGLARLALEPPADTVIFAFISSIFVTLYVINYKFVHAKEGSSPIPDEKNIELIDVKAEEMLNN